MKRIAVIGAGAAGCFCAANLRKMAPELDITVFEGGPKPMAKLAITGGGRCNLTNSFEGIRSLKEAYPRGEKLMKRALKEFTVQDTLDWFTSSGVSLTLQEDHCYFPVSQDAMDVVRCLQRGMQGVDLRLNHRVTQVRTLLEEYDAVVVTTGGATKGFPMLTGLDIDTVSPVPSLFTFNIKDKPLNALMGLVVNVSLNIPGSGFKADGPLLITDWGLSGPAVLKLSSYAARYLSENCYTSPLTINWMNCPESEIREKLLDLSSGNPAKMVSTTHLLQARLWEHIVIKSGLRKDIRWGELGTKGLNRLVSTLVSDNYLIEGKSKFRDEFVTCGGVSLDAVELSTLHSKNHPGLYFAGEVLDIDAITGGFNLQAAWSTGFVVAKSIARDL